MTNYDNTQKPSSNTSGAACSSDSKQNNSAMMASEIKKVWNKLSDEDIKLYEKQPDQFFAKVKEKHNVSTEDAQKRMKEIKASCGCTTEKAA
jgi:hypothetical protein